MKIIELFAILLFFMGTLAKLLQVVTFLAPGAHYHTNDLYDGAEFRDQWGEITPVGLRQHQELGKLFR